MTAKSLAQDAASWYMNHIDSGSSHAKNVRSFLRGPVLRLTCRVLSDKQATKEQSYDWDQAAFLALDRRNRARMEGFLMGCSLAVPAGDASIIDEDNLDLQDGLKGFDVKPGLLRSRSNSNDGRPQIRRVELTTRLELFLRTLLRVKQHGIPCVVHLEPQKAVKARAMGLVRAFVATVGCVASMGPNLSRLLEAMTQELLAIDTVSDVVVGVIRRIVLEYEHQVSFASLAFLSSPEDSAEHKLAPLVVSYLQYLQHNWEIIVNDCEMECLMAQVLDTKMRQLFKHVEFKSIGHLLEVCEGYSYELQNIDLPPKVLANAGDMAAVKQAIRDLQREVLTVNGHALPPVHNRKELVQLLTQTLNSRSLFRRKHRSDRRVKSSSALVQQSDGGFSSSGGMSSGNEGDLDICKQQQVGEENSVKGMSPASNRRRSFHLATVDVMTRRLLLASSRTGSGGDAYFIVKDLFGDQDVEVVPSKTAPTRGRPRSGTIEIVVRLSSVTIKCNASFDVYPKSLVGECEPLIQLHTTTIETIALQEVRASDSDDGNNLIDNEDDSSDDEGASKMVLQEKRTDKTGWRTLAIRPALYEAVEEWNTPS